VDWPPPHNGNGGGGTRPNPTKEKQKAITNKTRSDCDGVTTVNNRASLSALSKVIDSIKNKNTEFAVAIKVSDPTNSNNIIIYNSYTNSKTNSVNISPKWDKSNGDMIGFMHNHPGGSSRWWLAIIMFIPFQLKTRLILL